MVCAPRDDSQPPSKKSSPCPISRSQRKPALQCADPSAIRDFLIATVSGGVKLIRPFANNCRMANGASTTTRDRRLHAAPTHVIQLEVQLARTKLRGWTSITWSLDAQIQA